MCDHLAMYFLIFYRDCEKAFHYQLEKDNMLIRYMHVHVHVYMYHRPYTSDNVQHPAPSS